MLARWTDVKLGDGRPVALRELSGFVHAESTAVAEAMRHICFAEGENVIIHGTLGSLDYLDDLFTDLDKYGYKDIIIYDVVVPVHQAVEQSLARWWAGRADESERLGGRFVPPSAIRAYYPGSPTRPTSSANARRLAARAERMGWRVDIRVAGRHAECGP